MDLVQTCESMILFSSLFFLFVCSYCFPLSMVSCGSGWAQSCSVVEDNVELLIPVCTTQVQELTTLGACRAEAQTQVTF